MTETHWTVVLAMVTPPGIAFFHPATANRWQHSGRRITGVGYAVYRNRN
jgi:hypothetical protein